MHGSLLIFQVLEDRTNYLVLVVFGDVALEDLDEDMRRYMRTNTYLRCDDRWFWEKLRYHLPQRPLSEIQRELNLNHDRNAYRAQGNDLENHDDIENHNHINASRAQMDGVNIRGVEMVEIVQ